MAEFGSGWWERGSENPLGNQQDFSLQSGDAVEDVEGQWQWHQGTGWDLGLLVGLMGAGRAGLGLPQGRN